jgi:uncharacterized cupin superfamily protein
MAQEPRRLPIRAADIAPRAQVSTYPAPFAARLGGRQKRRLGDAFGLTRIGVNLTILPPGAQTALLHRHSGQDEMVYVLAGAPTLVTDEGECAMEPGMCVGFRAEGGPAHHIVNRSPEPVHLLEIGDRSAQDRCDYPQDDLVALADEAGGWRFTRKDGTPYTASDHTEKPVSSS